MHGISHFISDGSLRIYVDYRGLNGNCVELAIDEGYAEQPGQGENFYQTGLKGNLLHTIFRGSSVMLREAGIEEVQTFSEVFNYHFLRPVYESASQTQNSWM